MCNGKTKTKSKATVAIIREFEKDFKEESLKAHCYNDSPWRPEESEFKQYVERLGLRFIPTDPESLNCVMYWIAKYDYDDEGFMIQKNVCIYRRITGVYGGCLVQLKDENGKELASLGRIW